MGGANFSCAILLPIVRRHTTPEGYRAILSEVMEVDPEMSVQALDDSLLP